MIGPNFLFFETWITHNPGLLRVYHASYEPMTFQLLTDIFAPLRMIPWRKNGEDALFFTYIAQAVVAMYHGLYHFAI